MGAPVTVPIRVLRGPRSGATVFVTGAVHGDELNGTGIIRELMFSDLKLESGTLILVPVVNVFGFERHSRYLPDRRDLNRSFPGEAHGNLTARLAHTICKEVIDNSNFGIDLHSAAAGRTNFPHVRADLRVAKLGDLAGWFGCEVIVDKSGQEQSLRQVASERGVPTINLEGGAALRIEPAVVELGVRGVKNVLRRLGMLRGRVAPPAYQTVVKRSQWVRAQAGGLLRFHVAPGDLVEAGDAIATCDGFFRAESPILRAPVAGIVLGMTTLPVVRPGEPVCHLGVPRLALTEIRERIASSKDDLHRRLHDELARDVHVQPTKERGRRAR
jgi:uncharacterized protein